MEGGVDELAQAVPTGVRDESEGLVPGLSPPGLSPFIKSL
jgi:hypothetical protein